MQATHDKDPVVNGFGALSLCVKTSSIRGTKLYGAETFLISALRQRSVGQIPIFKTKMISILQGRWGLNMCLCGLFRSCMACERALLEFVASGPIKVPTSCVHVRSRSGGVVLIDKLYNKVPQLHPFVQITQVSLQSVYPDTAVYASQYVLTFSH